MATSRIERATASLAAACLAEGQQVIDAAIELQDGYLDRLMNKRLSTNVTQWSEQPLTELGELAPVVDHLRGLLNRERRKRGEPLDQRRTRSATLTHMLDGGVL